MGKSELAGVFALLPTRYQEEALIGSMELLFAKGEWQLISDLLERIKLLQYNKRIKNRSLLLEIKAALRLREEALALERFQLLCEPGSDAEDRELQAEALFHILGQILPYQADLLASLWQACGKRDMPETGNQLWKKGGLLLAQALIKNREPEKADRIRGILAERFPNQIYEI